MLHFGPSVTDAQTRLVAITADEVFHRIRDDKELAANVERLRRVKQLDQAAYSRLKVKLPFFCCGTFRDGVRRMDHFISIDAFVLDVDKYASDVAQLNELKERLRADVRVCMVFTSPGGDGVKILFKLDEQCTDTKQFSDFYKSFAYRFGEQYGLTDKLDFRTFDVSRVCFLSSDAGAYYDPICEPVSLRAHLEQLPHHARQMDATELTADGLFGKDTAVMGAQVLEAVQVAEPEVAISDNRSHQIRPDVYKEILSRLGTQARPKPNQRDLVVPEVLSSVVGPISQALGAHGILVTDVRDISYGKQITVTSGSDFAVCNVFYSAKRGFSVVAVPKAMSNVSLMDLLVFVAEQAIYGQ